MSGIPAGASEEITKSMTLDMNAITYNVDRMKKKSTGLMSS